MERPTNLMEIVMPTSYDDEDHYKIEQAVREEIGSIKKLLFVILTIILFPIISVVIWFVVQNENYSNSVDLTRKEHNEIVDRIEKLENR